MQSGQKLSIHSAAATVPNGQMKAPRDGLGVLEANPVLAAWLTRRQAAGSSAGSQSSPHRQDSGLGAVRDAQLLDDPLDKVLDGAQATVNLLGDLLVSKPRRQQFQHLTFPWAQGLEGPF